MLDIDIEFRRGVLFIRLGGLLINSTKNKLRDEIITLINKSGITNIVINLKDIEAIDESGLNMIFMVKKMIESKEGNLVICNTPIKVQKELLKNKMKIYLPQATNELTALNIFNI